MTPWLFYFFPKILWRNCHTDLSPGRRPPTNTSLRYTGFGKPKKTMGKQCTESDHLQVFGWKKTHFGKKKMKLLIPGPRKLFVSLGNDSMIFFLRWWFSVEKFYHGGFMHIADRSRTISWFYRRYNVNSLHKPSLFCCVIWEGYSKTVMPIANWI